MEFPTTTGAYEERSAMFPSANSKRTIEDKRLAESALGKPAARRGIQCFRPHNPHDSHCRASFGYTSCKPPRRMDHLVFLNQRRFIF
jgi:hypothetical protein